ncbi:hypothetical protein YC2023_082413 [Brassica napus]
MLSPSFQYSSFEFPPALYVRASVPSPNPTAFFPVATPCPNMICKSSKNSNVSLLKF